MNQNISQNVVTRLQKLMALAQDKRGNEHEASAAMAKVQELLAEYNLSLADIQTAPQEGDKRAKERHDKQAMYEYQRSLFRSVARAHYCVYWTGETGSYNDSGRWAKRYYHCLVGREANVIAAKLMFGYLNTTIERLSSELYPHPRNLSRSALSWKEGCAYRLGERLSERQQEADAAQKAKAEAARQAATQQTSAGQPCTALVLLSDVRQSEADLNNDFRLGLEPGTTTARRAANDARWNAEEAERVRQEEAEAASVAAMDPEAQARYFAKKAKEEAEAEARAKKWQERYDRQWQKKWANKDMNAFWQGHDKGKDIGLDPQVSSDTAKKIAGH